MNVNLWEVIDIASTKPFEITSIIPEWVLVVVVFLLIRSIHHGKQKNMRMI